LGERLWHGGERSPLGRGFPHAPAAGAIRPPPDCSRRHLPTSQVRIELEGCSDLARHGPVKGLHRDRDVLSSPGSATGKRPSTTVAATEATDGLQAGLHLFTEGEKRPAPTSCEATQNAEYSPSLRYTGSAPGECRTASSVLVNVACRDSRCADTYLSARTQG